VDVAGLGAAGGVDVSVSVDPKEADGWAVPIEGGTDPSYRQRVLTAKDERNVSRRQARSGDFAKGLDRIQDGPEGSEAGLGLIFPPRRYVTAVVNIHSGGSESVGQTR
jgi:hypothetical protein